MSESSVPAADEILGAPSPPVSSNPKAWVFPGPTDELFEALKAERYRKIILQVPAGLTRNAHDIASRIASATGASVVVAARACFGGCDFPSKDESVGAEAQVVLGHAPIPNVPLAMPTFFVEMRHPGGDPEGLAEIVRAGSLPARLGLVVSIQHLDLVPALREALARRGYTTFTGTGDRRLAYAAQALGCNYTSAESVSADVDAFLFVGTGSFHPIGLAFAVDKPVFTLDPLQNLLEPPIDRGALIRKRQLTVAQAMSARSFGILVSSFAGQNRSSTAYALQRRAITAGRDAEIIVCGRLEPGDLEGRALDAYVNTACPRIALDDGALYQRPMLTVPEFLMALGELPVEPYRFDTYH
ncbi:MAG: diphthamide biosynthesis enzyme Dph2 [Thermoplasmata archaeon]|nr:diphthamide biosynthesis enzyme Dph2 [Thermoplasmata archaeon]